MGRTMPDDAGNRLYFCGSGGDSYLYHASAGVDGFALVEDEVANAVVDGLSLVGLNGLQRVGVVTYNNVGPGINHGPCLSALQGVGCQLVLNAPVGADDDVCRRIAFTQSADALAEAVNAFL